MSEKTVDIIFDFVTDKPFPNMGSEENRQAVERFLVNEKGFLKQDIEVDAAIEATAVGEHYKSKVDIVVSVNGKRFMVIKCAAGSLGSREREILAAARLLDCYQIPFSVISDGKTAILLDTVSGKNINEGLNAIPSKMEAIEKLNSILLVPFPKERVERESIIFRSYDSMYVNRPI